MVFVPFTNNTSVILALFALSLSGINAAISFNVTLVTHLVHRARDVGKAISLTILAQYLRPAGADRHRLCGGRPALV